MPTIKAIAYIISVGISNAAGGVGTGSFDVNFNGQATDGTNVSNFGGAAIITIIDNPKKMDSLVRQAIAAAILAASPSFVIDPFDIYIPFSQ